MGGRSPRSRTNDGQTVGTHRNVETTSKARTIREACGTCRRFSAARTVGVRVGCRRNRIRRIRDGLRNAMTQRLKRATPPVYLPAARRERNKLDLGFDGVGALPVLALGRRHGQAHFLSNGPDRKPRTECACQLVAFINSLAVTPPGRFSNSRTLSVLLPSRADLAFFAPLGAFLAGVALLPDFPFFFATWAPGWQHGPFSWPWAAPRWPEPGRWPGRWPFLQ